MVKFSHMKKLSKYIIAGVTVTAVIGAAAIWRSGGAESIYETEPISRGTVIQEVTVTGSLQPAERVSLEPEVSGKVIDILVTEGDQVMAGDTLVKFDDRDLQSRISSQRAALSAARATLRELVAGPTVEDLALSQAAVDSAESKLDAAEQSVVDAETSLAAAKNNLEVVKEKAETSLNSKSQDFIDDMRQAKVKSADAMNRLSNSLFTSGYEISYSTNNSMAENEAIRTRREAENALQELESLVASIQSQGTLDGALANYSQVLYFLSAIKDHMDANSVMLSYVVGTATTALTTDRTNISTAQTNLSTITDQLIADKAAVDIQKSQNESEKSTAEIAVNTATAALNSAKSTVDTAEKSVLQALAEYDLKKSGARPENIDAQRSRVLVEEATLNGLLTDLSKRQIVSPIDGVVTGMEVERGETVSPGVVVVSLNAQGRFEIVSNISEVDIAKVKEGQPVHITLDAFSRSEEWLGKVTKIFPAEKVVDGVIFYETKVVFDEDDERLKSGMTANLSIETARKDDVLRIPLRALKQSRGKDYIELLVDGAPQEVEVELGVENTTYAELASGAEEGDLVIVSTND